MTLAEVMADLQATDDAWREVVEDGNPDATGGPLECFKEADIGLATKAAGFALTKFGLARDLSLKGIDNITFNTPPQPEEDT